MIRTLSPSRYALVISLSASLFTSNIACASKEPLSAVDAAGTARFMPVDQEEGRYVSVSPDGRRFVIRIVQGDVARDGVWVDIMAGALAGRETRAPRTITRLYSTGHGVPGYGGPAADTVGYSSPLHWVTATTIAFLFSNAHEIRQVVTVDLDSGISSFQTDSPTQIHDFDISADGTIVYLADPPLPANIAAPVTGFVVPDRTDAVSIVAGIYDGSTIDSRASRSVWFLKQPHSQPQRINIVGQRTEGGFPSMQHVSLAPDGLRAILSAPAAAVPVSWDQYAGRTAGYTPPTFKEQFRIARLDSSSQEARGIVQLYVLDVAAATATPLWDAVAPRQRFIAAWSPDARYVVLSPVPPPISEQGNGGPMVETVLFDLRAQTHRKVPVQSEQVSSITWELVNGFTVRWRDHAMDGKKCFDVDGIESLTSVQCASGSLSPTMRLEVRQTANSPPQLFSVGQHGANERLLFDPNPGLMSRYDFGKVRYLSGYLSTGERWTGLLTLPVHYVGSVRYPLVLQAQGPLVPADRFTLYGWTIDCALGPSQIAPYAAQILAGRDIAVLHFGVHASYGSPAEIETTQRAYEELSAKLVSEGIVDEHRIGINGFSREGYFAYHAISHSTLPFAAAVVADNVDYSYVQVVLGNQYADAEATIGAPAFGDGLRTWMARSTGFNVERIRAPLLLIGQSSGTQVNILHQWEILSKLRWLKRPVEMYLMPDIDAHPSHGMQNPRQVIAVQERVVDWFDFWLNGHESPDVGKKSQYAGWRALRLLRETATPEMSTLAPPPRTAAAATAEN